MRRPLLIASALLLATLIGVAFWLGEQWQTSSIETTGIEPTPVAQSLPDGVAAPSAATPQALVIGEYRPDTTGLPPTDAPLTAQIPELKAAAARGNATAACRLAVIGTQCATARNHRWSAVQPPSAETRRQVENELREQYASVSLDALPERYRAHAQRRLDTLALQDHDRIEHMRAWSQRCADAPPIPQEDIIGALRQSALAGEPNSMVRYASGLWTVELAVGSFGAGFGPREPRVAWLRSPLFDQWRREAPAMRRAGLERGDPEMLWMEFAFTDSFNFSPLEPGDRIEKAAALRAYAALVGGDAPESTASLGLSPAQAADADRLSETWTARARQRGRSADDIVDVWPTNEMSACD